MNKTAGQIPEGFVAVSSDAKPGARGLAPALQVTIGTGQRCPYCRAPLQQDERLVACVACLTVAHGECAREGGGACTTLGCARIRGEPAAERASSASPTPRRAVAGWFLAALKLAGGAVAGSSFTIEPRVSPRPAPIAPPGPALTVERADGEQMVFDQSQRPGRLQRDQLDEAARSIEPGPSVRLDLPGAVRGSTLLLRGRIDATTTRVHVVVRAPGGQELAWDAPAGIFESALTLPGAGVHDVSVTVRDGHGRETTERRAVVCAID